MGVGAVGGDERFGIKGGNKWEIRGYCFCVNLGKGGEKERERESGQSGKERRKVAILYTEPSCDFDISVRLPPRLLSVSL